MNPWHCFRRSLRKYLQIQLLTKLDKDVARLSFPRKLKCGKRIPSSCCCSCCSNWIRSKSHLLFYILEGPFVIELRDGDPWWIKNDWNYPSGASIIHDLSATVLDISSFPSLTATHPLCQPPLQWETTVALVDTWLTNQSNGLADTPTTTGAPLTHTHCD